MRRTLLILTSLVAALVAVSPATAATTKTVSIKRAAFSPATVNIIAGDSIRWRNDDTQNHQVVSTTGAFASPVLSRGKTYTFRFDVAGTYQLPQRPPPVRHRHDQGRRTAPGGHARASPSRRSPTAPG